MEVGRDWRMGRGRIAIGAARRERRSSCRCWIMPGRACIAAAIYPSIKHYPKAIRPGRKMRKTIITKIYCIASISPSSD